jgi:Rieske Fe-S protein
MDRRSFIHTSCVACVAGFGLATLLGSCTTNKYVSCTTGEKNIITVKKTEFTTVKKGNTKELKYILLKPENFAFPIAVYKMQNDQYVSLLLRCTHQGCELNPYEITVVCPCHGSEFNTKGDVTNGPAEKALTTFVTTSDRDNIYIQLA